MVSLLHRATIKKAASPPHMYSSSGANVHHHLTHASLGPPESLPNRYLDWFSRFCTAHRIQSLRAYFTLSRPFLLKIAPSDVGIWTPSNTCFFGQPESTTQMASRSVQPFFAELTIVTDGQTDHATRSVFCNIRPHLLTYYRDPVFPHTDCKQNFPVSVFTYLHLRPICGTENSSQQTTLQCLSTINMVFSDNDKILIKILYFNGTQQRLTDEFAEKSWTNRGVNKLLKSCGTQAQQQTAQCPY